MEFRYGTLADYAGEGANYKAIIVGIFDRVIHIGPTRPIPLPFCYLVALLEAHPTEGVEHRLRILFNNADGRVFQTPVEIPIRFAAQGPGRPMKANVLMGMQGLSVPDLGDYVIQIWSDGKLIGRIPFYATDVPVK